MVVEVAYVNVAVVIHEDKNTRKWFYHYKYYKNTIFLDLC